MQNRQDKYAKQDKFAKVEDKYAKSFRARVPRADKRGILSNFAGKFHN